ncbi:carbohydrate ABC transporter membrane protein 2, CUT1 family [Leifsonia sp. 98AMF]|uniref:carbohydrate ABC transporter permease n=1 Tax=unclassified Leifsonia TaxID=2663824 RepID=UPI00087C926F|nr:MULTISPECIES: carbohydrate ABC transporter permease [unclassified Leifsonia]SDH74245.1 carbohydrate ABC transporter membrane protein 2, CUT1 family [Leifsonia sp. 197AMF]SDJ47779.1 carbohydrate ABC transporter membrane protein 2, CUT1 family [Leifsonia sp. 466MF]SDK27539.1 carbohydrate ABC transporter membrane protein 2, CUT1 family [Leifsonia sp. 157MF]SDN67563.1 carbohydrate ABC transporter membrane protein 2, CUT1 family [Leifsonia sp. 509MF]SEN40801.1 carbohydrate ABC transporter membra
MVVLARLGRWSRSALVWVLLLALVVVVLYPLLWMVTNALKTNAELFGNPFALPTEWLWQNFAKAWNQGVGDFVLTSVSLTVLATLITELISAWAAYGLTRVNIPLNRTFTVIVLAGLMLAPTVALIPLVKLFQAWGLYDTFFGLLILYTAFRIPFTVFLMRAYMLDLPREVDEAASIDGASRAATFWRIILPMSMPIVATTIVLNVLQNWNEYLFAMIFTSGTGVQTLPVGLADMMSKNGTQYPVVFAGMVMAALPMVILFFVCQRYFVRGLAGGVGK